MISGAERRIGAAKSSLGRNILCQMLGAALLAGCAAGGYRSPSEPLAIAPAPISFDGHVAGRATDLVFVLVKDANPATPGIGLAAGERLMVTLPKDFQRNPASGLREDSDFNLVLTRGWPQAAVPQKGQYRIVYDERSNAIGVHAMLDIKPEGPNAPGIKVIHLRGNTFLNLGPGDHPVRVSLLAADGSEKRAWQGQARIEFDPPRARLAPTNFHLAPGTNSDYQKTGTGREAPHWLGLLLWGPTGSPLNFVGIAPRDLARYPRYIGGLLVQETDGDGKLDPARDKVVGGIIGAAPAGAKGQSATSPLRSDGKPILSGQVPRHEKYPGGGGKVNPGLLPVKFHAGDKPGLYRPTFELIGGNSYQFTIEAR
ncbi:MAG: hypothetical protein AB1452_08720 [Pseudomonadota bacterium]